MLVIKSLNQRYSYYRLLCIDVEVNHRMFPWGGHKMFLKYQNIVKPLYDVRQYYYMVHQIKLSDGIHDYKFKETSNIVGYDVTLTGPEGLAEIYIPISQCRDKNRVSVTGLV